jgi:TolB protein
MSYVSLIIVALLLSVGPAQAQVATSAPATSGAYIRITDANFKKSLMAVPPFQFSGVAATTPAHLKVGKELFDVFRNDMEVSGYFEFIKQAAYVEDPAKTGLKPVGEEAGGFKFESWKQIGTEFLVRVGYRITGSDVTIDTYTYYVPQAKLILAKTYKGKTSEVRTIAHTFANDVVKELTGRRGMFLSRIVTSRSTRPGQKEIFVMDWDGANSQQVSSHKSIAQSPSWSFDGKMIAYSAFAFHANEKRRNLDLFTYDTTTGRRFLVSYRKGINSGSTFTPSNRHIMLTISNAGNPDLYKMSLDGKTLERITNGPRGALNVEASVSPDGNKIAFSSDRNGRPHIFVMNADGTSIKQITIAGEYNSSPRWSPDGKRIVFAGSDKGHFDIFTVNADGSDMIRLTSAKKPSGKFADNEDPSYSPDGRNVLFVSNRTGANQLYIVTVDGETEKRITFDNNQYFKPHWSPAFD